MTESDHSGMAEDRDDESSVHRVSDIPVHSTHYHYHYVTQNKLSYNNNYNNSVRYYHTSI